MVIWSQDTYLKAWNFAGRAHLGQAIPGSEVPYINHVGSVVMEIMTAIALQTVENPDLAVQCALLHDVIEDTSFTYEQLRAEFGVEVADGVSALSKDHSLPKEERMRDSLGRIIRQPKEVWMVKMADRITNLQPPPAHWPKAKIAAYRDEAVEIHRRLRGAHPAISERLLVKIEAYGSFVRRASSVENSLP
jgi:(p)ppGpp synthase/HD superfamily hydrolase